MGTARLLLSRFNSLSSRLFSSSAALIRRPWAHFSEDSEDSDGESSVYRRALRVQRPSTVKYLENLHNAVSLIGKIEFPLKEMDTRDGRFGVHTFLKVRTIGGLRRSFMMMLSFWDEMAEMSVQHVKPNDQVYVSGCIRSYVADNDEKFIYRYKVDVMEINFIYQHGQDSMSQNSVKSDVLVPTKDFRQMRCDRHHLWQIFFGNPYEWWDNRNNKTHPNAPDFKHKDTGEALWLQDSDPPWIKKQLQLHDSRSRERSPQERKDACLYLSPLIYDDQKRT